MSGGKGGSDTSQVQIPAYLEDAVRRNLTRANQVSQIGYTPYYGADVAAMTPSQNAAMQGTNQAANAFGMSGGNIDPNSGMPTAQNYNGLSAYSSAPMYEQSVDQFRQNKPSQYNTIESMFGNGGGYGGGGGGVDYNNSQYDGFSGGGSGGGSGGSTVGNLAKTAAIAYGADALGILPNAIGSGIGTGINKLGGALGLAGGANSGINALNAINAGSTAFNPTTFLANNAWTPAADGAIAGADAAIAGAGSPAAAGGIAGGAGSIGGLFADLQTMSPYAALALPIMLGTQIPPVMKDGSKYGQMTQSGGMDADSKWKPEMNALQQQFAADTPSGVSRGDYIQSRMPPTTPWEYTQNNIFNGAAGDKDYEVDNARQMWDADPNRAAQDRAWLAQSDGNGNLNSDWFNPDMTRTNFTGYHTSGQNRIANPIFSRNGLL